MNGGDAMGHSGFGPILRACRAAQGWTQRELAERAGVAVATVQCYERGVRAPSLACAELLADALGVTLDQLAGRAPVQF